MVLVINTGGKPGEKVIEIWEQGWSPAGLFKSAGSSSTGRRRRSQTKTI